jgi:hypothetical protein
MFGNDSMWVIMNSQHLCIIINKPVCTNKLYRWPKNHDTGIRNVLVVSFSTAKTVIFNINQKFIRGKQSWIPLEILPRWTMTWLKRQKLKLKWNGKGEEGWAVDTGLISVLARATAARLVLDSHSVGAHAATDAEPARLNLLQPHRLLS